MKIRIAILVTLLAASTICAQQKQVRIGGGPPDELRGWPDPELRPGLSQPEIVSAIASYTQKLYDTDHFSGVVLVDRDGKTLLSRAWGLADVASKTPNTLDTKFNIGSINKVFTKLAIGQLAQAGKLSLDDTIRKHLPDYPSPVADRITIDQLIKMKSGIGDIFGPKYDAAPPSRLRELSDFLPLFVNEPLQFEPGTSQAYSNGGYIVLGLIIERLSGEKYRDYVQKHIFAPARMKDTGFYAIDEKVANRATGYTRHGDDEEYKDRRPNGRSLPGRPSSAGGAYATASDVLRFFEAASTGKLLSPKWTTWMFNGLVDAEHKLSYGAGGGAPGLNTFVEINDGWTVIAMSNYDPPAARAVTAGAMNIIHGRKEEDEEPHAMMHRAPSAPENTEMSGPVSVPLAKTIHLLMVEAMVNGKGPFHFVVDSGAAGMLHISNGLAKTLALEQVGEAMTGDPSGKHMERQPVVRIDTVEIGGARFSGMEAVVGDGPGAEGPDGVIGLSLFANLTATLDYRKSELRLTREPIRNGVAFTTERGIPEIDIDVAGVPMKVDVDTGSPATLSIPTSWAARLPLGESRVVGRGRTVANEFEIRGADLKGDLHVAGFTKSNPRVDMVDLFPVANLGSRFLSDYAVSFDMANKRMGLAQ